MSHPQTEFDTPWKEVLERYFAEFICFFFPQAHREIDWTRPVEFLDKELQQVVREAELGQQLVDKLVKIYRSGGEQAWVLVHVEVQTQQSSGFAKRMYAYNYRIYDRYQRSVVSLAVLGDERRNWRPNQLEMELWGCEVRFIFPVVKLLDYSEQWSSLEASHNPFATVVMAHLKAQQTRNNRNERLQWKLILTKRLYEQDYSREDVVNLFRFIDWLMSLPEDLEADFWQQIQQLEVERQMPYITSVERSGIQKGLAQGLEQGLEQGRSEGIREGLLEGIALGLRLKFGSVGLSLLPEISQIAQLEQLKAILAGLAEANTLEQLRSIYQQQS